MLRGFGRGDELEIGTKRVPIRKKEDFHLVNVDLELQSPQDLQLLIDELERDDKVMNLYHQGFENECDAANFEMNIYPNDDSDIYKSYDDVEEMVGGTDVLISAFCDLLENLPNDSREIWNDCTRREFDIGFQCGNARKTFHTQIRTETVNRCAALGASILITVYPYLDYEIRVIKRQNIKKMKEKKARRLKIYDETRS